MYKVLARIVNSPRGQYVLGDARKNTDGFTHHPYRKRTKTAVRARWHRSNPKQNHPNTLPRSLARFSSATPLGSGPP